LANRPRALGTVTNLFSVPQRHDPLVTTDPKRRERRDRIGDVLTEKIGSERHILFLDRASEFLQGLDP
jgi:hypothetical protein